MGMFDSVFVVCPYCGVENELQTKNGECSLGRYSLVDAPPEVLLGVEGGHTCEGDSNNDGCGCEFTVIVQCITKSWVKRGGDND